MADIRIGYVLDSSSRPDPSEFTVADEVALRYRWFLGDVILEVGDMDASARWGWVPILDFALSLRTIAEDLRAGGGERTFEFTESEASIRFAASGDALVIDPSYVEGVAGVPLADFALATVSLLSSLLNDLVARYRPLSRNEFIANLLDEM
jgi:hypothetical protein